MKLPKSPGWYSLLISFVVGIVSIMSYVKSCNNENLISEFNEISKYESHAVNLRPRIDINFKLAEGCAIHAIESISHESETDTVDFEITAKLIAKVNLENNGNSSAIILGNINSQKNLKNDVLQNALLKSVGINIFEKIERSKDKFFEKTELKPGENYSYEFQFLVRGTDSTSFFINHHLVLYENEMGVLFDSYLKLRVKHNPILFANSHLGMKAANKDLKAVHEIKEISQESKYYNFHEKQQVFNFIEQNY